MEKLETRGAIVSYNDPYIPVIKAIRKFSKYAGKESVEVSGEYDLILISTAHDEYRNIGFEQFGVPVIDTRNIIKGDSPLFYRA